MEKNYNPSEVENKLYKRWLDEKYFHAEADETKTPFTIVIPPPNITGQLHMGHALNCTLQDIIIRSKRMQGYNALWVPGTDHASISTELKIVEKMAEEGITKEQIGREQFLKRAWEWKEQYGSRIVEQLKKLGSSCDWERERFTMDSGLSEAVLEVFIRLYEKGLIYRGEKIVNWCPNCKTTISDAEVEHKDLSGNFWHFKYPIDGTNEFLAFATTRPETMLGDTAIAVNPNDVRYKKYVGKTVTVPIVNRKIPIVADEYVEMDFGTGVVKITPSHDPNDFEVGERHNLPKINIMNDNGTLNKNAGSYCGLLRYEARDKIIEEFKNLGLFIKAEPITHAVGVHGKCNIIIEPLIKRQWFVKMEEMAKPAIEAYKNKSLKIIPERFGKVYLHWLENIKDWCISRQLWWGHRVPAYYCQSCGEIVVSRNMPNVCEKCKGKNFKQDEDTLDTWFSSALWPFSTLGWPNNTKEMQHFFPTNVLVTAYDILFFWVIRMVFSSIEQTGKLPFTEVLFHGLIRDDKGRKMSKSLGNGIDPLEVIEKYGTDALRLTLVLGNSPGNDFRFYWEKLESNRNFLNKIWNATRFVLMNLEDSVSVENIEIEQLTPSDKWILSKINTVSKQVCENLNNYELGIAISNIYDFVWDEFCDWYIEMVKPRLYNKDKDGESSKRAALYTLKTVLVKSLKLLHPFIPFITEEIFMSIQDKEPTIMRSQFPAYDIKHNFAKEEREIGIIKDAVKQIRNLRAEMNVAPSKKVKVTVVSESEEIRNIFTEGKIFFATLGFASDVLIKSDKAEIKDNDISVVIEGAVIYMPFAELIDISKEVKRLEGEVERLKKEVLRIDNKLSNEGFISKAPEKIVLEEKEKRLKYSNMLEKVLEQLERLNP